MDTLNQEIQFGDLNLQTRNAFTGCKATKCLVKEGTNLFRFSRHSNISPWWSETKILPDLLLAAKGYGKGLYQYVRDKNAVLRLWNPDMRNLLVVKLTKQVYGFHGMVSPQNEATKYMNPNDLENYKKRFTKSVFFRGGMSQLYIPGISLSDVVYIVPTDTVSIYDNIDEIIEFLISYKVI